MTIYSPNMLKTYQTCPRLYYLKYIEKFNPPTYAKPFEKGKKIHALANYYLQGVNISRIETALTKEERETWQTLLNNPFFQKEYLNSEYQLSCKIGKYWIGGRIDAIVHDNENYYILDYKTGSIPQKPEKDLQTIVYMLCLDKHLESKYETLSFVYINLKQKNNYVIKLDQSLKKEYENSIIEICNSIETDTLFKQNLTKCNNCSNIDKC